MKPKNKSGSVDALTLRCTISRHERQNAKTVSDVATKITADNSGVKDPDEIQYRYLSTYNPNHHLVDALPYVDAKGVDELQSVNNLIEHELRQIMQNDVNPFARQLTTDMEKEASQCEASTENQNTDIVNGTAASHSLNGTADGDATRTDPCGTSSVTPYKDLTKEEKLEMYYLRTLPVPSIPRLSDPNSSIGKEFQRCKRGEAMQKIDTSRYNNLDAPSLHSNDPTEIKRCLQRAKMITQYSTVSVTNFNLMNRFAQPLWNKHIGDLTKWHDSQAKKLTEYRTKIEELNKKRKLDQIECGNQLRNLQLQRDEVAEKNSEITVALSEIQMEVQILKKLCLEKNVLPKAYQSKDEDVVSLMDDINYSDDEDEEESIDK